MRLDKEWEEDEAELQENIIPPTFEFMPGQVFRMSYEDYKCVKFPWDKKKEPEQDERCKLCAFGNWHKALKPCYALQCDDLEREDGTYVYFIEHKNEE